MLTFSVKMWQHALAQIHLTLLHMHAACRQNILH